MADGSTHRTPPVFTPPNSAAGIIQILFAKQEFLKLRSNYRRWRRNLSARLSAEGEAFKPADEVEKLHNQFLLAAPRRLDRSTQRQRMIGTDANRAPGQRVVVY